MVKIIDSHSGVRKFIQGRGRKKDTPLSVFDLPRDKRIEKHVKQQAKKEAALLKIKQEEEKIELENFLARVDDSWKKGIIMIMITQPEVLPLQDLVARIMTRWPQPEDLIATKADKISSWLQKSGYKRGLMGSLRGLAKKLILEKESLKTEYR